MRAAVKNGAKVLVTSRTYIWNAAKRDLKCSDFPLIKNSQVIIDVQGLSETERAQILYNHIKLGDQPLNVRRALKSYLAAVAANEEFLPETARRLGSQFFTGSLKFREREIKAFVERPVDFLVEVLRGLDNGAQAAIALVFMHGTAGVLSPVRPSSALDTVLRLTGVTEAVVTQSLEILNGSLTLLVESDEGPLWTFKHATISDAYAALVAESPEKIELYIRGAKQERLFNEVVCGDVQLPGASVSVPPSMYSALIERLVVAAHYNF